MFAVPGWSLSADKLRPEKAAVAAASTATTAAAPSTSDTAPADAPSKKRKRPGRGPKVTDDNVAELWEKVIEKKKRQENKTDKAAEKATGETAAEEQDNSEAKQPESSLPPPKKAKKQKRSQNEGSEQTVAVSKRAAVEEPAAGSTKKASKDKPAKGAAKERPAAAPVVSSGAASRAESKPAASKESQPGEKKGKKMQKLEDSSRGKAAQKEATKGSAVEQASAVASQPPAREKQQSKALAVSAPAPAPAPALKLTPLQASMRAKLISARFRHLNETLYTRPSEEALRLFAEAPDMFLAYHEGFRQQVAVWPSNPVDGYVEEVRRRAGKGGGKNGSFRGGRDRHGGFGGASQGDTLPRTRGTCHIVDAGCGDARLAASLAPVADRLRLQVLSYDLHADPSNPHITAAADAADLPLPPDSTDIVVFCLALMGTNWLDFVEEAYRVLRWKGELWVAEIKSRFAGAAELRAGLKKRGAGNPVSHSVGYRRKTGGANAKGGGGKNSKAKGNGTDEDDPDVVAAALAEVDGWDEGGGGATTDVSAFVNALRRRGFVLDDTGAADADGSTSTAGTGKSPAVDLDNKMFVKMRFLKAAPALVGKQAAAAIAGAGGDAGRKKLKFLDNTSRSPEEAMEDPAVEAKILKPCVYKLR